MIHTRTYNNEHSIFYVQCTSVHTLGTHRSNVKPKTNSNEFTINSTSYWMCVIHGRQAASIVSKYDDRLLCENRKWENQVLVLVEKVFSISIRVHVACVCMLIVCISVCVLPHFIYTQHTIHSIIIVVVVVVICTNGVFHRLILGFRSQQRTCSFVRCMPKPAAIATCQC